MADIDCCKLVGNLDLGIDGCIISINSSCSTEVITACVDEAVEGPTTGSISLTAYADEHIWIGCPARAGVSIPYVRKYDCDNDIVYFIFSGKGQSYKVGDISSISLMQTLSTTCTALSASSTSGPTALYMQETQTNGYGMTYSGDPISFSTTPTGTEIALGGIFKDVICYLQNFSFQAQPGELPTVTYSLVYPISVEGD